MHKITTTLAILIFFSMGASAQQRIVLIEQFTNSGCPPCATSTPTILNYVDANPSDVVAIAYHTSFPYNDSMYFENPVQSTTRTNFYSVSGVPYSVVDGNYYSSSSSVFAGSMASVINTRKAMPAQYNISESSNSITGNILNSQITFSSLLASNVNDSLRAFVVVIEKTVLKSAYAASPGANSETQYEYVMRRMITTDSGTSLQNRNIAGSDIFNINWTLSKIKDINEVRVVGFVQNKNTKEVYQAVMFTPTVTAGIGEDLLFTAIDVYPNPADEKVFIQIRDPEFRGNIELTDITGRIIYSTIISGGSKVEINTTEISDGMYLIHCTNGEKSTTKKLIIR
ncbi:MAG: T9SS type A sorting domain-containing protein [Bacteroidetes bacterium]|nr:T9SS type A sorting domain-containing protein [Bacteroidota bacterium]